MKKLGDNNKIRVAKSPKSVKCNLLTFHGIKNAQLRNRSES